MMRSIKLTKVIPEKKWDSIETLDTLETLSPEEKADLCTIFLDVKGGQPELLKVPKHNSPKTIGLTVNFEKIHDLNSVLGTILIKSDPALMCCLRQSQLDKKAGNFRKFDDIARECNL
jgi:hypothetical protein